MTRKAAPRTLKAGLTTLLFGLLALLAERFGLLGSTVESTGGAPSQGARPTAAIQATGTALVHGLPASAHAEGLAKVKNAFEKRLSDVLIEGSGRIVHLLPDDEQGSRHQLFLLELEPGLTLKISHNIDLAPYVPVERGDSIAFFGEYEWNEKGGVIHWTHHDPAGRHPDGWLLHEGRTYQ